jgi:membrane protease YdiL (CAAX protease family)
MNTPTLYLDLIILAAAAYPSGFSNSLFTSWRGEPREASTRFLRLLALPYPVIVLAVWAVRPEMLSWRATTAPLIAAAVLLAPLALLIEYGIHALALYRASGSFPRGLALQGFWRRRFSPIDHLLIGTVAIGEEILYRGIWFSVLLSFGLPTLAALLLSSLAYGLNHLSFGSRSVMSKTVTGMLYCALYIVGGQSLWLPIISHVLQNILLLALAKERHA